MKLPIVTHSPVDRVTDGQGQTDKQIMMETGSENNYLTSSVSKVTAASRDWSCWNLVSSSYLTWLSALTSHTWNTQTNWTEHYEGLSSTNQWDVVWREKSNKGFIGCDGRGWDLKKICDDFSGWGSLWEYNFSSFIILDRLEKTQIS